MHGRHAVAAALKVAVVSSVLYSSLAAQGTYAEHTYGGFVNAVWLERIPLISGDPDGFRVWTAEDGSRIRFYDSVTDTTTQMNVLSTSPQTLHDIYLDQYPGTGVEALFGVAVGTGGEAVWWDSLGHTNWKPFTTPPAPGKELWACAVEHEATGTTIWVSGEDHLLKISQDQGATWTDALWTTSPAPNAALTSLDFADWSLAGTNGIVGTDSGELFFTTDGVTWTAGTLNGLPSPASPLVFWDIDFRPGSTTEAIAVGGRVEGGGEGFAWRTTDGGQTWNRVLTQLDAVGYTRVPQTAVQPGHPCTSVPGLVLGQYTYNAYATLYGVHMRQNGQALIVGYGGQTWRYLPNKGYTVDASDTASFSTGPLWGAHGDGQQQIWLSGQFGTLRRTSDGGNTFESMSPNNSSRFRSLAFPTKDTGYVVGQSMRIQKTTDAGQTWTEQLAYKSGVNLGPGIESIAAYDVDHVVAIANGFNGSDPVAFVTADGGATCWTEVDLTQVVDQSQGGVALMDVAFGDLDGVTGLPTFYVSTSTTSAWSGLMRSVDGGLTWTETPTPAGTDQFSWHGVAALGTTAVVLVGHNETANEMAAYVSLDADNPTPTWTSLFQNAPNGRLFGVAVNGATMIAVGSGGSVYEYSGGLLVPAQGSVGVTNATLRRARLGFDGLIIWAYVSGDDGTLMRSALTTNQWDVLHPGTTDDILGLDLRLDNANNMDAWLTGRSPRWGDSAVIHMR
jgi:photosystem II stability/assembly factor-like uncharacterized protein